MAHDVEQVHLNFDVLQIIFIFVTLLSDIDIHDVSGYTVGTQHLQNLSISSAEMTHYLCNIKIFGYELHHKEIQSPVLQLCLKGQNSSEIYGQANTIQDSNIN